jgi:hypothetical protein
MITIGTVLFAMAVLAVMLEAPKVSFGLFSAALWLMVHSA